MAAPPITRVRLVLMPAELERGLVKLKMYEVLKVAVQEVEVALPEFIIIEHCELAAVVSKVITVGK